MTLKDLCGIIHDLPVWVNADDGCNYYADGWKVPATNNMVKYITVNGNGILTVEVVGDLWVI